MTEILFVSDGLFHPPFLARRAVRQALAAVEGSRFTQVRHLDVLTGLDMVYFQALVLYFHHKRIAPEALAALEAFVQNGGGILAIHSATASFKDQPRYFEILGGRFSGHGPVESFDIRPSIESDPVFEGIGPFTVKDEAYLHDLQRDIQVQFGTQHGSEALPVVWTRMEGDGRVCYVGPGHRTATMQQPGMQAILRRGLQWVIQ